MSGRSEPRTSWSRRILEDEGVVERTMLWPAADVEIRARSRRTHLATKQAIEAALTAEALVGFGGLVHSVVVAPRRAGGVQSLLDAYRGAALADRC